MNKKEIKQELLKWYDKEHLWKWEYVLDFVLHILAKVKKELNKN